MIDPRPKVSFQYPQSDRGRCNDIEELAATYDILTFSILSRIVGAATGERAATEAAELTFSILSRIVGAATRQGRFVVPASLTFSILSRIVGAATSPGMSAAGAA